MVTGKSINIEYFMSNVFDNRELATTILLAVALFLVLIFQKEIRQSLWQLVRAFLQWKIIVSVVLMIIYTFLIILIFYHFQLWDFSLLKYSIFWFGTALVMLVNFEKVGNDLKKQLSNGLKWVIVLEFIISLYTFSIWGELLIIPTVFFLVAISVVAGTMKGASSVKKTTDFMLSVIGIYIIIFALTNIINDFHGFWTVYNAKKFLLPIVLTGCYLPFIYLATVYGAYEQLFLRIDMAWFRDNKKLATYAKKKIFQVSALNLNKIKRISNRGTFAFVNTKTKRDIFEKIKKIASN